MEKKKAVSSAGKRAFGDGADGTNQRKVAATKSKRRPAFRQPKTEFEQAIQRYVDLFDFAPMGYVIFDRVGRIEEINFAAAQLLGRSRKQLIGITFAICIAKEHTQLFLDHLMKCRSAGGPAFTELCLKRTNGEKIPVLLSTTATFGLMKDGARLYQTAIVDLTERKRAEKAAVRLAAVVQSSHDAVAAKNLNGIITDWNQSAERIFGYKPEEIIGKSVLTLIPKERQSEEEEILRTIRRGESLDHYETIRRRKDGKLIDVSLTISPIKDAKGEIIGISKIARDITKQKQTERRLAEQARLLDLTSDAVIVRDYQNRIIYWNRGAEEMYGFSAKEALGRITHELLKTRYPENYKSIRKRLERDNRWSGELIHARKDGKTVAVFSRWSLDPDARGQPASILETNTDVTARKRAEQQHRALYQFAQLQHIATNVAEIYEAGLAAILSALSCQRASILLFDKKNVMRFAAWRSLSEGYRKAIEGHSPWKPNAKNSEPVCINDVDIADIPKSLKSTIRSEGIRAVALIPLVSSQKLIGKFMTYYDAPHVFTDNELALATTIATQLAEAIKHKRDEEALRESEAHMRATVEQANAGMLRQDRNGRFIFLNRTFCRMLGYTQSELLGKTIADVTHRNDMEKQMRLFQRMIRDGEPFEMEKRYIHKDGSVLWADVSASAVRGPNGKIESTVAVIVDITARKKAEAALQKSNELLEERVRERTRELYCANKELEAEIVRRKGLEGEILAVSDREQQRLGQELHDGLCQHLTAVAFMARSIGLRLKNHRVIEVSDIEKIADLVNEAAADTRNLSRALHRIDVDAAGFVTALEDLVDREIWRIPCRLEVKASFHIDNDATAGHLYRIAREAVINANKHSEAREIQVKLERSPQGMVLRVIDNGIGFLNGPNLKHGLGFHIMNYRARLFGGSLEIDSPKHGGTRVSCYLPNNARSSKKKAPTKPLPTRITKALAALI
jgi:PAS domain S-box-containing protein